MSGSRLRTGQLCPLHRSYFCCGRKSPITRANSKLHQYRQGVTVIQDEHHPRGFRERCSPAELARRKTKLMQSGMKSCFYCKKDFVERGLNFEQVVLAHLEPKGMGGARADDHVDNLTLACWDCNLENGSRRPAA